MTNNRRIGAKEVPLKEVEKYPDLAALKRMRNILHEFYPDVRVFMLEYLLEVCKKDLEL